MSPLLYSYPLVVLNLSMCFQLPSYIYLSSCGSANSPDYVILALLLYPTCKVFFGAILYLFFHRCTLSISTDTVTVATDQSLGWWKRLSGVKIGEHVSKLGEGLLVIIVLVG
jgi:hypothetical protein